MQSHSINFLKKINTVVDNINKKIYFMSLVFLFIFLIGSVSATEINNETLDVKNKIDATKEVLNENDNAKIECRNIEMYYKDGTKYSVKLIDSNNKPISNKAISLNIYGRTYERYTNLNGEAKLNINLLPGYYKIISQFKGDNKYKPTKAHTNFIHVKFINTTISGPKKVDLGYKSGKYSVILTGGNNKPLAKKNVTFIIYGIKYNRITDYNGKASLNINLNLGKYEITAHYKGEPNIFSSNKIKATINVKHMKTSIIASPLIMDYKDGKYSVKLIDENKNPLSNRYIQYNIYGMTYKRITNSDGISSLNINLNPNIYKISYKFLGDLGNSKSEGQSTITVKPAKTKLNGENCNVKFNDGSYYSIELLNNKNKPIKNAVIKTDIISKNKIKTIYSRTYENGIAKLKIDLNPGKYIFKSSFSQVGYKNSYVENKIIVDKQRTILESQNYILNRKGEGFLVSLKNSENKMPISNQKVEISCCGKTYTKMTNEYGIARLNINLNYGDYIITYKFKETSGYYGSEGVKNLKMKNIKLGTTLTPLNSNITRKGTEFKVLLKDQNGIPLKNQCINIKIYGMQYKRFTDENGIAKLRINLDDNNYNVQSFFEGSSLFKKCNIMKKINVNTSINCNYSFEMAITKLIKGKDKSFVAPLCRIIEVNANNKSYIFFNDGILNKGYDILKGKVYFIPFSNKNNNVQIFNSENAIKAQGISLRITNENFILIKYHTRINNLANQLSLVYSACNIENFRAEKADIILNDKIEASIKYTNPLITMKTNNIINSIGGFFINFPESSNTILETDREKINRTVQFHYGMRFLMDWDPKVPYETIQSYVISREKISDNFIYKAMEKNIVFKEKYEKTAYELYLLSLSTSWVSDKLANGFAKDSNVVWNKEKSIVLTTKEWVGLSVHANGKVNAFGNKKDVRVFKLNYGLVFSLCEKLALEMYGQEATCAVSEIMEGILLVNRILLKKEENFLN